MRTDWNIELVREFFNNINLELIGEEYINNKTPITIKDNKGYMYKVRLDNIMSRQGLRKIHKSNPYSLYNIQLDLNKFNPSSKILSKIYEGNTSLLTLECGLCHEKYKRSLNSINKANNKICRKCSQLYSPQYQKKSNEEIYKLFKNKEYELLPFKYKNNFTLLECIDKNGYKLKISFNNLQRNRKPLIFSGKTNFENYLYNLKVFSKNNKIDTTPILVFKLNKKVFGKFKCICGENFTTEGFRFVNKSKLICDKCSKAISHRELKVMKYLESLDVCYLREYTFKDCKKKKCIPFDFYLPKYNLCIEVDGEQHYREAFGDHSKFTSKERLEITKENDKIKTDYCNKKEIFLLRIPYWEFKNEEYKKKISKIININ